MSIATVIITKNEEANITECLRLVEWTDELIVVDAYSVDRTVEIAQKLGAEVLVHEWSGYGPQKNFGIEQAQSEWILIVDADERVTTPLRNEITEVLAGGPASDVAGFEIPRRNYFYGRWIRGGGMYPDPQLRLFRRAAGRYDDTALHEQLGITGRVGRLKAPLDHYSMPTVAHHVRKMMRYTTLAAQEKLKTSTSVGCWPLATHHLGTIFKTFLLRQGYRDGVHGLIAALFAGLHTCVKYAKAWEMLYVKRRV